MELNAMLDRFGAEVISALPPEPEIEFRRGELRLVLGLAEARLRLWPAPRIVVFQSGHIRTVRSLPCLDALPLERVNRWESRSESLLAGLLHDLFGSETVSGAAHFDSLSLGDKRTRLQALNGLIDSIPGRLKPSLARVPAERWRVLVLAHRKAGFRDLLRSNPELAGMLAAGQPPAIPVLPGLSVAVAS